MKTLVIAAHPDDEVLGCGGTIARLAGEGHEIHILILGEGITSRHDSRDREAADDLLALHACCREAGQTLGARDVVIGDLPDNRFDSVPLLRIVKQIEAAVERIRPETVYTQHGGDLNIDHKLVHRATLTATRPTAGFPVKSVYAYEVASATEWSFQEFSPVFRPNVFVDISRTLDLKIRAMELYASELRPFPHPRSPEALRAAAVRWGSVAGLPAAEAFELIRSVC